MELRKDSESLIFYFVRPTVMFSCFVRGVMSATLLQIGLTSTIALVRFVSGYSPAIPSFVWFIPGVLALPLAFLLFTSSVWIYRLAFTYLAFLTGVLVSNLILVPMVGGKPAMPLETSLEGIVGYSFPCIVALIDWFRRRSSKQVLEPTPKAFGVDEPGSH